jgi:hypothetical protein
MSTFAFLITIITDCRHLECYEETYFRSDWPNYVHSISS